MNTRTLLSHWSGRQKGVPAWRLERGDVTYEGLRSRVEARARHVEAMQIGAGDVVAVAVGDLQKRMEIVLSLLAIGAHVIVLPAEGKALAEALRVRDLLCDGSEDGGSKTAISDFAHLRLPSQKTRATAGVSIVRIGEVPEAVSLHGLPEVLAGSYAILGFGGQTVLRSHGFDPGSVITIMLATLSGGGTLVLDEGSGSDVESIMARVGNETANLCVAAADLVKLLEAGKKGVQWRAKPNRIICLGWHLDRAVAAQAADILGVEVHVAYPMFDVGHDTYSVVFGRKPAPRTGGTVTTRMRSMLVTMTEGGRQCAPGEPGRICLIAAADLEGAVLRPLGSGAPLGEIIRRSGVQVLETAMIARQYRDGFIELMQSERGATIIQGRLINLDAIERTALSFDLVRECVAVMRYEEGQPRIVAYASVRALRDGAAAQIRSWLRANLPSEMVPAYVVPLSHLPIDSLGRVDTHALMAIPVMDDPVVCRLTKEVAAVTGCEPTMMPLESGPFLRQPSGEIQVTASWAADVKKLVDGDLL